MICANLQFALLFVNKLFITAGNTTKHDFKTMELWGENDSC